MKILSTFDTEFKKKIVEEERKRYGDKVFSVHKGRFFLWLHVILPAVALIIWFIWLAIFLAMIEINETFAIVIQAGLAIIMCTVIYFGYSIFKQYIDYILDFSVITPEQIISYNQTGFFSRQGRTLDVDKIKTISVSKEWLVRSIFDFGSIVFLSEWDTSGRWDIELYFIDHPDEIKSNILNVINTTTKKNQSENKAE